MEVRRAAAVTVLTVAALAFASRFHGVRSGGVIALEEPPTTPTPSTTTTHQTTSTVAATSPVTSTAPPTTVSTTVTTVPPSTTTTTIPLPVPAGESELFEGPRIRTRWGSIKVEIAVEDGVMVDVELLMIPSSTKRSKALTLEYEPQLRDQALTRQSPFVDAISGATTISEGYGWSLSGAMKEAGIWPRP